MIQIGILDSQAITRVGIKQILGSEVDMRVVFESADPKMAAEISAHTELNVLIMDFSMHEDDGVDVLGLIKKNAPRIGILVLSGYAEEHYAFKVLRKGAIGYLRKDCLPHELIEAVRRVAHGKLYVPPNIASSMKSLMWRNIDAMPHETLSPREYEVFIKMAKGGTAGGIARELSLSVKTISTFRSRIMIKLSLKANSDLTYYAVKNDLI